MFHTDGKMVMNFSFSLRSFLICFALLSVAIASLVVKTGDVSSMAFLVLAFVFPTLTAVLGLDSRGVLRAFYGGTFLPAAGVAVFVMLRIDRSFARGRLPSLQRLPGELRLAISEGRMMATVGWPFAIVCGVACGIIYWLLLPSRREGR